MYSIQLTANTKLIRIWKIFRDAIAMILKSSNRLCQLFRIPFVISNFISALSHFSSISTSEPRIPNLNLKKVVEISRWTSEIGSRVVAMSLSSSEYFTAETSFVLCYPFENRIRQNILYNRKLIICSILCLLLFPLQKNQHKQQISWIHATRFFGAYQLNIFICFIASAWYRFNI